MDDNNIIQIKEPFDILDGRGGHTQAEFHQLWLDYRDFLKPFFKAARTKRERYLIKLCLINFIRRHGGRFIKRRDDDPSTFQELSLIEVLEKCSAALRETRKNATVVRPFTVVVDESAPAQPPRQHRQRPPRAPRQQQPLFMEQQVLEEGRAIPTDTEIIAEMNIAMLDLYEYDIFDGIDPQVIEDGNDAMEGELLVDTINDAIAELPVEMFDGMELQVMGEGHVLLLEDERVADRNNGVMWDLYELQVINDGNDPMMPLEGELLAGTINDAIAELRVEMFDGVELQVVEEGHVLPLENERVADRNNDMMLDLDEHEIFDGIELLQVIQEGNHAVPMDYEGIADMINNAMLDPLEFEFFEGMEEFFDDDLHGYDD